MSGKKCAACGSMSIDTDGRCGVCGSSRVETNDGPDTVAQLRKPHTARDVALSIQAGDYADPADLDKLAAAYLGGFSTGDGVCPFCGDDGFDLVGLKIHNVNGYCDYSLLTAAENAEKETP